MRRMARRAVESVALLVRVALKFLQEPPIPSSTVDAYKCCPWRDSSATSTDSAPACSTSAHHHHYQILCPEKLENSHVVVEDNPWVYPNERSPLEAFIWDGEEI